MFERFGNEERGLISYTGGHRLDSTSDPDNIAAMRSFFNFSFYAGSVNALDLTMSTPTVVRSGQGYEVTASATASGGVGEITYNWVSSCGGTFSNPSEASTTFTPDNVTATETCLITCFVTDECGTRTTYLSNSITIEPALNEPSCMEISRCWTYTDECGNETTVCQSIIVSDTIAPVFDGQTVFQDSILIQLPHYHIHQ